MLSETERQMPHFLSHVEPRCEVLCMCVDICVCLCVGHEIRKDIIAGGRDHKVEKQGDRIRVQRQEMFGLMRRKGSR